MRGRAVLLAAAIILAPLGAKAADLVVWWEEGYYAQEDEAVREIVAAFEQGSGKQVELVLQPSDELPGQIVAALEAGRPPDFAFGGLLGDYFGEWAFEDRLVDLTDTVGHFSTCSIRMRSLGGTLLNQKTGQRALYALPIGRTTIHVHVWESLLERAGFTLEDIPKEWEAVLVLLVRRGAAGRAPGHWDATTSGASAFPCRATRPTPGTEFDQFRLPTRRTT